MKDYIGSRVTKIASDNGNFNYEQKFKNFNILNRESSDEDEDEIIRRLPSIYPRFHDRKYLGEYSFHNFFTDGFPAYFYLSLNFLLLQFFECVSKYIDITLVMKTIMHQLFVK